MKGMQDYARKSYLLWVIADIVMIMKILLGIIIILNLSVLLTQFVTNNFTVMLRIWDINN